MQILFQVVFYEIVYQENAVLMLCCSCFLSCLRLMRVACSLFFLLTLLKVDSIYFLHLKELFAVYIVLKKDSYKSFKNFAYLVLGQFEENFLLYKN